MKLEYKYGLIGLDVLLKVGAVIDLENLIIKIKSK